METQKSSRWVAVIKPGDTVTTRTGTKVTNRSLKHKIEILIETPIPETNNVQPTSDDK